jgi:DNA polymerase III epsilon subunit-like protein
MKVTDPNTVHVMIDLETLSTRANATILSIGATKFTLSEGIIDKFYCNIDAKSCKTAGLHVDKSTIDWWMQQSAAARDALLVDQLQLVDALQSFTDWIGRDKVMPWGNGASFDISILESAYAAVSLPYPWRYSNIMCYRTVMNLMGLSNAKIRASENDTHHHALDDAISQTNTLLGILQS